MSPTMEEREQAFEAKFAHDEEMRFMVLARRDKNFARWAAVRLGLDAADTEALVQAVVHLADGPEHDAQLLAMIGERLRGQVTPEALSAALAQCLADAHAALDATAHGTKEQPG